MQIKKVRTYLLKHAMTIILAMVFPICAIAASEPDSGREPSRRELQMHRDIEDMMSFSKVEPLLDGHGGDPLVRLPYSIPANGADSAGVCFPELYFVNAGLLRNGDIWLTRDNIENLTNIASGCGFTPCRYPADSVTPARLPLLSQMVREYYMATGNRDIIRSTLPVMEEEYRYFTSGFTTHEGLTADTDGSGLCSVDVNAVMYGLERNMAFFMRELAISGDKLWDKRAADRRKQMQRFMLNPSTRLYHDYDSNTRSMCATPSHGVWAALWAGVEEKGEKVTRYYPRTDSLTDQETFFALRALDRQQQTAKADSLARYILNRETSLPAAPDGEPATGVRGALFQTAYRQIYGPDAATATPRVVNIVQVLRRHAPAPEGPADRSVPGDSALLAGARQAIDLMNEYNLKGTYLVRYDALADTNYQNLLRQIPPESADIGAWFEITGDQARQAGLKWGSRSDTDPRASLSLPLGYKPKEREKLVDEYMKLFRDRFGAYPRTVGGIAIDAHTLAYMRKKYNVESVIISRDRHPSEESTCQLTGGYSQGAYYPSAANMFMPAQTTGGAIGVVAFRFPSVDPLGFMRSTADGTPAPVITFEPGCPEGGGDPLWSRRALHNMLYAPAFGEARLLAGQECAAPADATLHGYSYQIPTLARLANKGDVRVETIAESTRLFRAQNTLTPATAITATATAKSGPAGVIWYNSRWYRAGVQWGNGQLCVRDLHLFDENASEPWLTDPCTTRETRYATLPVVDADSWSSATVDAGMRFHIIAADGSAQPMRFGHPHASSATDAFTIVIPVLTDTEDTSMPVLHTRPRKGLKKGASSQNICRIDDIPYERRATSATGHKIEMVITFTDNAVDFTLRPAPMAQAAIPGWYATIEHAADAEVPFGGAYLSYTPGNPPSASVLEAVSDGYTYRLTLDNGAVYNTQTSPRTAEGAIRSLTFVPELNSLTLRAGK